MKKILIINGPNLNMLGVRSPELYGKKDLASVISWTEKKLEKEKLKIKLEWFQSNSEGEIVNKIQSILSEKNKIGLIINPAGFSHTSVAILDSLEILETSNIPIIEVHITNLFKREGLRQTLLTAKGATAIISGLGPSTYFIAIKSLLMEKE